MSFPLFIARRLATSEADDYKVSRPAIRIATAGVAIGLAVMIVTVAVVMGFKHTVEGKVTGFGSHIQLLNVLTAGTSEALPVSPSDSLLKRLAHFPNVESVQRFSLTQGILKTDDDFLGIVLKGVGPEFSTDFLQSCMVEGQLPHFSDTTNAGHLVVSKTTADQLRLRCGQRVFAYFVYDDGTVRTRRFTVDGIFQTHLKRFDDAICLTDLYTATRLNGWTDDQCTGLEVRLSDFDALTDTDTSLAASIKNYKDDYGQQMTTRTIRESYPQVFSWLELLDINVWIILALMVCVAGFTMISGLLIIILERTQMIGLLKALGARNKTVRHTFLWFATFIIGKGLLWGYAIGVGLVLLQQYTGLVKLDPQTYYVEQAPVEISLPTTLLLGLATLLATILVLIAPSFLVSHIHPARTMNYE